MTTVWLLRWLFIVIAVLGTEDERYSHVLV